MPKWWHFCYLFDMPTLRDALREVAFDQHGYLQRADVLRGGASPTALKSLVARGRLQRVAHGVYRDPVVPASANDLLHLAVLWTGVERTYLSHESALAAYELGDVNPDRIHVTVPALTRIRRRDGEQYVVHHEDLRPDEVGWFDQIPTVTPAKAVAQCIVAGTPTYLLRQALEAAEGTGRITATDVRRLSGQLESRRD